MASTSSLFASAKDIPPGASSSSSSNDNNQTTATATNTPTNNQHLAANQQHQHPSKIRHQQKFRKLPDRLVELVEGEEILLGCEVDNQTGSAQWIKDRIPIFRRNGLRVPDSGFPERHVIVGKLPGDHSLELRRVDIADSGLYECQVLPAVDDGHEKPLRAISNVTVRAQPPPTPPATSVADASTSTSTLRSSSSSHLNQQQAQINAQSFSLDEFPSPSIGGGKANSQLQPRDIPSQMTKLPGALQVAATTSQLAPSTFITPVASTANGVGGSGGGQHLSVLSLVFGWWPALFLIAGCLFLANVYLIYSLVRRHKLSTSGSGGADGSASGSEASSSGGRGGGGGGGSSGSSTSTESCAKSNSTSISISKDIEHLSSAAGGIIGSTLDVGIVSPCNYNASSLQVHSQHQLHNPSTLAAATLSTNGSTSYSTSSQHDQALESASSAGGCSVFCSSATPPHLTHLGPNQSYHPHHHAHHQQQHPQHLTLPPAPPAGGHHHMSLPPAGPHYEFMLFV